MLRLYSLLSTKRHGLVVLLIILFLVFSNYIILKAMPNPIGRDSLAHFMSTIEISREFNLISYLKNPISVYYNAIIQKVNYPPLFHIVAALIYNFLNADFMFMTPSLFLILLIYSTYKIGEIMKNKKVGLLSATIVSFYPIVYLTSRHFNLDLAQAAMTCFTLYLLLRTEYFKNRKYSILFGCISGIGMLSKHLFILFIIGPLFVAITSLLIDFSYNRLKNFVIALSLFSLISLICYYWICLKPDIIRTLFVRVRTISELDMWRNPLFSASHLLFYFKSFKTYQIGLFNLILFLFSFSLFFIKKEYQKYRLFFLLWIALPLVVFTLLVTKYNEYTISYLPALAIITSLGILSIKHRLVRAGIVAITLIFNLSLYIKLTFPKYVDNFYMSRLSDTFLKPLQVSYTPASYYNPYDSKALDPDYRTVKFLIKLLKNKKSSIGLVNYVSSNWHNLRIKYLLLLYNTQYDIRDCILDFTDQDLGVFDIIVFSYIEDRIDEWLNKDYFLQDLKKYNEEQPYYTYFLWNGIDPRPFNTMPISQKQLEKVIAYFPKVKLIYKIDTPQANILIYKRIATIIQDTGDNASRDKIVILKED